MYLEFRSDNPSSPKIMHINERDNQKTFCGVNSPTLTSSGGNSVGQTIEVVYKNSSIICSACIDNLSARLKDTPIIT